MSQAEHNRRVDYVEFSSTDLTVTKRFYGDVFGWQFTDFGPDYTAFHDGRLNGGFAKSDTVSPGGPLVVIYATDLEALESSVVKAGGTITKATFSFPGGRRFHFTDPSGNQLAAWTDQEPAI